MAIMGSSGAGKSTLMNILTRRNIQGRDLRTKFCPDDQVVRETFIHPCIKV